MRTDLVKAMARREGAAALLAAPLVEFGARGPSVGVRLVECPVCGAPAGPRPWIPPFRTGPGPVLRMLSCETLTARAVLPIVVSAERDVAGLRDTVFETRALTWLRAMAGGCQDTALAAVDAAEAWLDDPAAPGRTLPASTRPYVTEAGWERHRERMVPSFLSPHAAVPAELEWLYAEELRAAVARGYALTVIQ